MVLGWAASTSAPVATIQQPQQLPRAFSLSLFAPNPFWCFSSLGTVTGLTSVTCA